MLSSRKQLFELELNLIYVWRLRIVCLGLFAKLRKVTVTLVMSVSARPLPLARMEQHGSYWKDFHDIHIPTYFREK